MHGSSGNSANSGQVQIGQILLWRLRGCGSATGLESAEEYAEIAKAEGFHDWHITSLQGGKEAYFECTAAHAVSLLYVTLRFGTRPMVY